MRRGEHTNLLVVALLRGEADDGLLVLAREVAGSSGLFVGDEVSLSRRNHHDDVRCNVVSGVGVPTGSFYNFSFRPLSGVTTVLTFLPPAEVHRYTIGAGKIFRSVITRASGVLVACLGGDELSNLSLRSPYKGCGDRTEPRHVRKWLYIVIDQNSTCRYDRLYSSTQASSSLQTWFWPPHFSQRTTGVPGVGFPWSDKSALILVPWTKILHSIVNECGGLGKVSWLTGSLGIGHPIQRSTSVGYRKRRLARCL